MERRDYLEDQIKQLAMVLANMIGFITGKKISGKELSAESVSQALKAELDLTIDDLVVVPNDNFIDTLKDTNQFNTENFEQLANVLLLLAESSKAEVSNGSHNESFYVKALLIYKYLEQNDKMYSIHRNEKIRKIENIVEIQ